MVKSCYDTAYMKDIFVIAGPNGAGKTTAAMSVLPDVLKCMEYVNADSIASGLSPFKPSNVAFESGRLMLKRIKHLIDEGSNFVDNAFIYDSSQENLIEIAVKEKDFDLEIVNKDLWGEIKND